MAVKSLQLVTCLGRPNLARLVARRSDDLVPLWVELNFRNLVFVTLKQCNTSACKYVVHSSDTICARGRQLVACAIKTSIKYFIVVTAESLNTLPSSDVP